MPGEAIIRVNIKPKAKANAQVSEKALEVKDKQDRIMSSGKLMLEGIKPIVNDTLKQLKQVLEDKGIEVSPSSVMKLVREAMQIVEHTSLKGIQQKELVNELLLRIFNDTVSLSEEHKKMCEELVNSGIIGETVELVVGATKGELDVNQLQEVVKETASCCFAFIKKHK